MDIFFIEMLQFRTKIYKINNFIKLKTTKFEILLKIIKIR
jgi:hypothetical protein